MGNGADGHDHHHDHDHQNGHAHGHSHTGGDFDWQAMAEQLELDATMVLPMVDEIVARHTPAVDWASIHHVLDLGCGPGVITCALAGHAPRAQVVGLDTSVPLLSRVRHHAAAGDLSRRVHTVESDMEASLPALRPMDVVWAGMVLHHPADPAAVLRSVRGLLQPGGTLVAIEFASPPVLAPADHPVVRSGAWTRMEQAAAQQRAERIGHDPVAIEWATMLTSAGFTDVTDQVITVEHAAPLGMEQRRWLERHVRRNAEWVTDSLSAEDQLALTAFADGPLGDDLHIVLERRVLTARRPGG
jgi:ubiquinone/menaquinone biosynthesis C-methylase UbiE